MKFRIAKKSISLLLALVFLLGLLPAGATSASGGVLTANEALVLNEPMREEGGEDGNLIVNGNFSSVTAANDEDFAEGIPAANNPGTSYLETQWPMGRTNPWYYGYAAANAKGSVVFTPDDDVPAEVSGKSLKIEMNAANRYLLSSYSSTPIKAGNTYEISFWYKTENLSSTATGSSVPLFRGETFNASLGSVNQQEFLRLDLETGSQEWKSFSKTFTTVNNVAYYRFVFQIASHGDAAATTSGMVWLAGVKLVCLNPDSISVTPNESIIEAGATKQLAASALPSYASQEFTWSSSDMDVATVDDDGLVTGVSAGNATIMATSKAGASYGTTVIAVTAPPVVPIPTDMAMNKDTLTLGYRGTYQLSFTVTPMGASRDVIWSSSDDATASVTQTGLVTAGQVDGTAQIRATSAEAPGVYASCTVTVSADGYKDPDNMILVGSEFEPGDILDADPGDNTNWPTAVWTQLPLKNHTQTTSPGPGYFPEWRARTLSGYGTLTYDTSTKASGEQSLLMNITTARSGSAYGTFFAKMSDLPLKANKQYVFSFWMKNEAPVRAYLYETDPAKSSANNVQTTYIDVPAGGNGSLAVETGADGWYRYEVLLTATNNNYYLKINAGIKDGTTGRIWFDDYRLLGLAADVTDIAITAEYSRMAVGRMLPLTAAISPSHATYTELVWSSSDTGIAAVDENGIITALAPGTVTITVYPKEFPDIKGTFDITVEDGLPAEGITISSDSSSVKAGFYLMVKAALIPGGSTSSITWESDNESVATVGDGLVYGISEGTAVISASANGHKDSIAITVMAPDPHDEFDELRDRWAEYLLSSSYDTSDPDIQTILNGYAEKAQIYWDNMNTAADGTDRSINGQLWNGQGGLGGLSGASAGFEIFYDYLYAMTLAFAAEGSPLYHNAELLEAIIFGMDFMNAHIFTASPKWTVSNWWERDIGLPWGAVNVITVLYPYLPEAKREVYCAEVTRRVITTDSTAAQYIAANRVDRCKIGVINGILTKRGSMITTSADLMYTANGKVLADVTSGNGIYYDGSYVEHSNVAYSSSYGLVLVEGIAQMAYLLGESSTYNLPSDMIPRLNKAMEETFLPEVFRGNRLASTTGRAISRQTQNADGAVSKRYVDIMLLLAEGTDKTVFYKGIAKTYLKENDAILKAMDNIGNYIKFTKLMSDNGIAAVDEQMGVFTFNRMARVVVRRSDYLVDFAMHNNRIADYEAGNSENFKGFHTGDGVMYLYNADTSHYQNNFWATVDYNRLPGTTVDTHAMDNLIAKPQSGTAASTNSLITWAGGAELDDYAAIGFLLNKSNITASDSSSRGLADATTIMNLKGAKSWFVFDDEIVALGSGITSGTGRTVETTIENRKTTGSNPVFTVDGSEKISGNGSSDTSNATWAHLEGTVSGADIGYYFPKTTEINILRESRTASWSDVNTIKFTVDPTPVSDDYVTMYIDHGEDPSGESYEYAVLPGYSRQQVEDYAANPHFEVLNNDANFHAVYHKVLDITAMNNYSGMAKTANGITVDKEAAVMVRTYPADYMDPVLAGKMKVTVNRILTTGAVTVTFDKDMYGAWGVDAKDSNVTLGTDAGGNTRITVVYDSSMPQNTWEAVLAPVEQESTLGLITSVINPKGAVIDGRAIMATVDSGVSSLSIDLEVSPGATWKLYSDSEYRDEVPSKTMTLSDGSNTIYIKVESEDGRETNCYVMNVYKQQMGTAQTLPWTLERRNYNQGLHMDFGNFTDDIIILEFDITPNALPGSKGLCIAIDGEGAPNYPNAHGSSGTNSVTSWAPIIVRVVNDKVDLYNDTGFAGGATITEGETFKLKVVVDRLGSCFKVYVDGVDVNPSAWANYRRKGALSDISMIYLGGEDETGTPFDGLLTVNALRVTGRQADAVVDIPIYVMDENGAKLIGLAYEGLGTIYKTQNATVGGSTTITAPVVGGYALKGNSSVTINPVLEKSIIVFTYKVEGEHTVTFNTNGGSTVGNQTISYGGKVTKPTDPMKEGSSFDGWYCDQALTQKYDFNSIVSGDMTLYAKWTVNEYKFTITFDTFTGSGSVTASVDGAYTKFVRLLISGLEVSSSNYAVTEGSTVITLSEAYLKTLSNGTYTVVVEFSDGIATTKLSVNVRQGNIIPATGVTLDKSDVTVTVGGTLKLTAAVIPTGATNKNVAWSSSDTSIAAVDATGKATGLKVGTATITVTTEDGSYTAACKVTVTAETKDTEGLSSTDTKGSPPADTKGPTSADTGDDLNIWLWIMLIAASLGTFIFLGYRRHKIDA